MYLRRVLYVFILGCLFAAVAGAQCWECEDLVDANEDPVYPGVKCDEVSVSDIGQTECQVQTNPGRCVFGGQICNWDPPPGGGHTTPPEQGCEWSSLQDEPAYQITPNGEATENWTPEIPALETSVG